MAVLLTYLGNIAMRLGLPDGEVVVRPGRQVHVPEAHAQALVRSGKFRAVASPVRVEAVPSPVHVPTAVQAFASASVATIRGWDLSAFAEGDLVAALASEQRATVRALLEAELVRRAGG